eukprot:8962549-Prorocentrum_lima.AAC.1
MSSCLHDCAFINVPVSLQSLPGFTCLAVHSLSLSFLRLPSVTKLSNKLIKKVDGNHGQLPMNT